MAGKSKIRKMYNEIQKQEYIDFEEKNTQTLTTYFKRLNPFEEQYNKDIASMNLDEIRNTLLSLHMRSFAARQHTIYMMRKYVNWAIMTGKSTHTANVLDNLSPDDIGSHYAVQTQMLRSPEQARHILNTVYNPDLVTQPNRACRDRLVFWLSYSNIKQDEIPLLKKSDIDFDRNLVKCPNNDKYYEINKETASLWDQHSKQTTIEKTGVYSKKDIYYYELLDNDYLLRPIRSSRADTSSKFSENSIRFIIFDIFKKYTELTSIPLLVSPNDLRMSWIYYKLYLHETSGEAVSPELINRYLVYDVSDITELRVKTRKARIDYKSWKEAFNY